jgi:hypothetical protein
VERALELSDRQPHFRFYAAKILGILALPEINNHIATFNQHSAPIFIASLKSSTHNDGLSRGNARNTNLAPMTIRVLPNYGTGEARAKKVPSRENLAKQKATLSNAVKC